MYLTLDQVRESRVKTVAGKCAGSTEFTDLVNNATQWLMRRGDWANTVVPIQVCTPGGCLVYPRYVDHVRKLNVCNRPVSVWNPHFTFLKFDGPLSSFGGGYGYGSSYGGSGSGAWWGNSSWGAFCGSTAYTTGGVETPVFQDIMGDGRYVRFYPHVQADLGKTVTVFGVDNGGNTLRHKLTDGTWEDGWVVTLALPFGSTADYVRRVDRIVFEDHEGPIYGYAYNAADDVLEQLGTYEAHDNNPSFTRYNLSMSPGGSGSCGSGSCCSKSIIALVKLRFIPARYGNDLVLIDNIDALALAVQRQRFQEANDYASAKEAELAAIRELNLDLNDAFPVEQTPVGNGTFSGTGVGFQRCW